MRFDLTKLYHGCPKELEEEFCNLYYPCSKLVMKGQIFPHLTEDQLFMRISEVKESITIILARFTSLLNQNYEPKTKYELSIKLKFIEDIGEINKSLDKETILKNLNSRSNNFPVFYNMVNEFMTVFDFIVYQPITASNKKKFNGINEYIKEIFKISSSNCAILGHSIRSENKTTQKSGSGLSKSSTTVLNEFESSSGGGEGDGDVEDEGDGEIVEDDEKKEIVEERPVINVKPTPKKRGRPKKNVK